MQAEYRVNADHVCAKPRPVRRHSGKPKSGGIGMSARGQQGPKFTMFSETVRRIRKELEKDIRKSMLDWRKRQQARPT